MKFFIKSIIFIIVFSFIFGCESNSGPLSRTQSDTSPDEGKIGLCFHENLEPILGIQTATSVEDSVPILQLVFSDFKMNGNQVNNVSLELGHALKNIIVDGDVLQCTIPCGFGSNPGTYEFLVSADMHDSQLSTIDAKYEIFSGGCPSYSDGGTKVDIRLTKKNFD